MGRWLCLSGIKFTLLIGILGGIVGVSVDIPDHLPILWGREGSRAFHTPILIVAGAVGLYCIARLGRLLTQLVLKR